MKLSEWRLRLRDKASSGLEKIRKASDRAAMRVSNLQGRLNTFHATSMRNLRGAGSEFRNQIHGAAAGIPIIGNLGKAMTNPYVLAGAAIAAVTYGSAKMAITFDQGMAKVNATAQLSRKELNGLRDEIIAIGKTSAQDLQALPTSFELILSQTNDVKLSMDILRSSVKAADATFADVDVVSGAVAQSLSLVAKEGKNATNVLDTFLTAKKVGAGEFNDFATYMPNLIASGQNLGSTFEQTAGAFAFMTAKGQSAANSAVLLQNLYSVLGKGDVQRKLAGAGIQVFDEKGSLRSMELIFGELGAKMNGMSDQGKSNLLENLGIRDMQAKSAFSVMISDTEKLKSVMAEINNSAGEIGRTAEKTATPMKDWAAILNQLKAGFMSLGNLMLPIINWYVGQVQGIIKATSDWFSKNELVQDILMGVGAAIGFVFRAVFKMGQYIVKFVVTPLSWILDKLNQVYTWTKGKLGFAVRTEGAAASGAALVPTAANATGAMAALNTSTNTSTGNTGGSNKVESGIKSISGGGTQQRNVTVNVTKLVEQITVHSETAAKGIAGVKDEIIEELMRIIRGAERQVSNG